MSNCCFLVLILPIFCYLTSISYNKQNYLTADLSLNNETSSINRIDNYKKINYYLAQNTYAHYNSTNDWFEFSKTKEIQFQLQSKYVFTTNYDEWSNNQDWDINASNLVSDIKQITPWYKNFSGSFFNAYETFDQEFNLVGLWSNYMRGSLLLNLNKLHDRRFLPIYGWSHFGNAIPYQLNTDILLRKQQNVNQTKAKIIYQNEEIYNNIVNQNFNFHYGISKNTYNPYFVIKGIPYVFMRENYVMYIVYNYAHRLIYALDNSDDDKNNQFTNDFSKVNQSIQMNFRLNDLIAINQTDYWHHEIKFGLNQDLVKIADYVNSNNFNGLSETNMNVWDKNKNYPMQMDLSHLNLKNNNYYIQNFKQIAFIFNELKDILQVRIYYQNYDWTTHQYLDHYIDCNYNDLINNNVTIPLTANENHVYSVKINNLQVQEVNTPYTYIPKINNKFFNDYSNGSVLVIDNNTYTIAKPTIAKVTFLSLNKSLFNQYASYVNFDDLIGIYIKLFDTNNCEIPKSYIQQDWIKLDPNDEKGILSISVITNNSTNDLHIYTGFKKFDLNQYKNLTIKQYQYGLIASEVNVSILDEYLNNIDFDRNYFKLKNITPVIDQIDDINGSLVYGNLLHISGFAPCYLKVRNDEAILKNYQPSMINVDLLKTYLIDASDAFINKFGSVIQYELFPDDHNRLLTVVAKYNDITQTLTYHFNNEKQIMNVWSIVLIIIGIILSTSSIFYLVIKNKKAANKLLATSN